MQLITHIFCFDDHRTFSEDVRKRFSDATRYQIVVSHNRDEFLKSINKEKDGRGCKVAIIGLHDSKENYELSEKMISGIKKMDIGTGIIILSAPEKIDDARKAIRTNVDAYIPRNSNAILRIHNTVKKLISEHNLAIYRRRKSVSQYALAIFMILAVLFLAAAWFRLPMYF